MIKCQVCGTRFLLTFPLPLCPKRTDGASHQISVRIKAQGR